jgi:hypothetical protein
MALTSKQTWEMQVGSKTASVLVKTSEVIYHGALVGVDANGLLCNWTDPSGAPLDFWGVASVTDQPRGGLSENKGDADKVTGDGTIKCKVDTSGIILKNAAVTSLDNQNDVREVVYASDENTLDLAAPDGSSEIGIVLGYSGVSGYGDVQLFSASEAILASRLA